VSVVDAAGTAFAREVLHPLGDPGTPFSWDDVQTKIARSSGVADAILTPLAAACRSLADAPNLDQVIELAAAANGSGP
jgi:hypothetical protein